VLLKSRAARGWRRRSASPAAPPRFFRSRAPRDRAAFIE
jgi:hypothetical protein